MASPAFQQRPPARGDVVDARWRNASAALTGPQPSSTVPPPMGDRLAGKVVLITGTAGGTGRAAAMRFAAGGAIVGGCDLDEAGALETVALVEAAGGRMTSSQPVDLGDSA